MLRLLAGGALLAVLGAGRTAEAQWVENGVPVCAAAGSQTQVAAVPDGAGGLIVVWEDGRHGNPDVFAQRLDAHGRPQWAADGVPLCAGASRQSAPRAVADGMGGAIVVWDSVGFGSQVVGSVGQRIDGSGTRLWGPNGTTLGLNYVTSFAADGNGGVYLARITCPEFGSGGMTVTRIDAAGAAAWSVTLATGVLGAASCHAAVAGDGQGGAVAAWGYSGALTAHRLAASGAHQWGSSGVAVTALGGVRNPVVVADGTGGAVVAWRDPRTESLDVYAQRLSASGSPLWAPNGAEVAVVAGDQGAPRLAADGSGGAYVAWEDPRGPSAIHVQRMTAAGAAAWTEDGVRVSTAGGQQAPRLAADGGGALVAWRESGVLRAQSLSAAGSPRWGPLGAAVALSPALPGDPALAADGAGGARVAWSDTRGATSDIYAQRVGPAGRAGFDHVVTATAGPGGTVSPAGAVGANAGETVTITMTPDPGYHVADVAVDGSSVGPAASHAFAAIASDHTLHADFAPDPRILSVQPDRGGDQGTLTVTVWGVGFLPGAEARLERGGESDVEGAAVAITDQGQRLGAVFDLAGVAHGAWALRIVNPDGRIAVYPEAVLVESFRSRPLRVDVIGPAQIRTERRRGYDLVLANAGNGDAESRTLWVSGLPAGAQVELDVPLAAPASRAGEPDWSGEDPTFAAAGERCLALAVSRIPPGSTTWRLWVTLPADQAAPFPVRATLSGPWTGSGLRSCLTEAGGPIATAHGNCLEQRLAALDQELRALPGVAVMSGPALWAALAWRCEGATSAPAATIEARAALEHLRALVLRTRELSAACHRSLPATWQSEVVVAVVGSLDPNDKLGPPGAGPSRAVAAGEPLSYTIRFENRDSAHVVAAQTVVVTDALDSTRVDPATVRLGPIRFGDHVVDPPPDLLPFAAEVDLRPARPLVVRIEVARHGAVLAWRFTSLDPATGQPVDDDTLGFLPPNATPPEGEGSVAFMISPRPALAPGTSIGNAAVIDFDGRLLGTPPWINVIDGAPPASRVLPLAAVQDSAGFTVRWEAEGPAIGLRDFTVLAAEEGGPYRVWRESVAATADTFIGAPGRTYRFASVARDSSGEVEAAPAEADAVTEVAAPALDAPAAAAALALDGAAPNPSGGRLRVGFSLPDRTPARLEIADVAGRRVWSREVGGLGPGRHHAEVEAAIPPGRYWITLRRGAETRSRSFVVLR